MVGDDASICSESSRIDDLSSPRGRADEIEERRSSIQEQRQTRINARAESRDEALAAKKAAANTRRDMRGKNADELAKIMADDQTFCRESARAIKDHSEMARQKKLQSEESRQQQQQQDRGHKLGLEQLKVGDANDELRMLQREEQRLLHSLQSIHQEQQKAEEYIEQLLESDTSLNNAVTSSSTFVTS